MSVKTLRQSLNSTIIGCSLVIVVSSCSTMRDTESGTASSQAPEPMVAVVVDTEVPATEKQVVTESAPEAMPSLPQEAAVAVVENVQEAEVVMTAEPDSEPTPAKDAVTADVAIAVEPETSTVEADQANDSNESTVATSAEEIPPNTFIVSAGPKQPMHPFYGVGHNIGLNVNGQSGKELVLVRGETYTFKVDTGVQHDFYLSKSPRGWGASTFADGVKGNFTYLGEVTFTPSASSPDVVFYQCRNHKNMGSKIHIVNKGEEDSVKFGVKDDLGLTPKRNKKSAFTNGNQVKQKLMFAEMMIASSPATKRIDASDNHAAKQLLADARDLLAKAKKEHSAGNDAEVVATVDEALRNMTEASQLVPSESEKIEQRAHFEELLHGAQTYEKSYASNLKMMQKKGKKNLPDLTTEQVSVELAAAQKLAESEQYATANKKLSTLQHSITRAMTELLAGETMDYTLTFDTPKDEYEYELARYKSFEELIPLAIEQKQPSKMKIALMDTFVKKAKGVYELSGPKAKEGDYKTAILMLQGATSNLERALRIVGVR